MTTFTTEGLPAAPRPLGPPQAFAAYAVLLFGFLCIAAGAQGLNVVAGLWASEAIAIALPVFLWLLAARVAPGPLLGLVPLSWKWVAITVVTALLNQPAVTLLEYVVHASAPAAWVAEFDLKTSFLDGIFRSNFWPMTLTVAIAAPVGEELFFRGFFFPLLCWPKRDGKPPGPLATPLAAALISGALFSAIHLDRIGFIGLMEIGVWLAVLRWGSGSLLAPLLGHALNNGAAAVAFKMGWQDPNETPPNWLLALGAVLLVAFCVWTYRVLRAPTPSPAEQRLSPSGDGQVRHRRAWMLWALWVGCCVVGLVKTIELAAKLRR